MQVVAKLANECISACWASQQTPVGGQRIERAKESQALYESRHRSIDGNHAFGLELAERDMNGPLIRSCGAEALPGQIDALSDAHAGVSDQQEGICAEVVSAHELLLKELILLGGEGPSITTLSIDIIF